MQRNKQIQTIMADDIMEDENELFRSIQLQLGLNRAKYWDLCPITDDAKLWVTAISIVCDDVGPVYHILKSNPTIVRRCIQSIGVITI
jgi:hypothetical protein